MTTAELASLQTRQKITIFRQRSSYRAQMSFGLGALTGFRQLAAVPAERLL
jgi:hypothetical protein